MSRAQGRHDTRRIKAKYYAHHQTRLWDGTQGTPQGAGMFANHGKLCSCWMCCNPRRLGLLTLQEQRVATCLREHQDAPDIDLAGTQCKTSSI